MTPRPKRILVVGHDAAMGGAQHALLETLHRLDACGYRPLALVPTGGPFVEALRQAGIECHTGPVQRWIFFRKPDAGLLRHPYLWSLLSLLTLPLRLAILAFLARLKGICLVYSNTITVIDGALTARLLGLPHVWHLHEAVEGNDDLVSPWPTSWLPRFILDYSERVIVNSEHLRGSLFRELPQDKVRIVFNGVDMTAASVPAHLQGIPDNAQLTAIVGRLNENKRIGDYLEALSRLQQSFPLAHHMVVGQGSAALENSLRQQTSQLGLSAQVHFLGYRDDVRSLLARVCVLVSASARESFGRTLIEAMAAGVPIVATRSGGPEEIVVDGECGYLVEVGDVDALAERIGRLLGDRTLGQTLGTAGRQRARKLFDLEQSGAEIVGIVEEALSRRK